MFELADPDRGGVAVAADADADQGTVGDQGSGGDGGHAAVQRIEAMAHAEEVGGGFAAAADAAEFDDILLFESHFPGGVDDACADAVVSTAIAEGGIGAFVGSFFQADQVELGGPGCGCACRCSSHGWIPRLLGDLFGDPAGGEGQSVAFGGRDQSGAQPGQFGQQNFVELAVAVIFDDKDFVVPFDKGAHLAVDGQGAEAQVAGRDPLVQQAGAGFDDSRVVAAHAQDGDASAVGFLEDGGRDQRAGGFELACQPLQIVFPVRGPFAVGGIGGVAGAACEVGGGGVVGAGHGAVGDAVAVDIQVASPALAVVLFFEGIELLGGEHLAAIERCFRVGELFGDPEIHADIEVAEHEDGGLEPFGEVEGWAGLCWGPCVEYPRSRQGFR